MQITDVKIRKRFDGVPLCAVASVTFDNCFTVHDVKVIHAGDRYFTVMPNRKTADGRTVDIAHPIDRAFRSKLENCVLNAYYEVEKADKNSSAIL